MDFFNQERNISLITFDTSTTLSNLAQRIDTDTSGTHRYIYDHPSTSLRTGSGTRVGKQYKPHNSPSWTVNTRYVYGAYGELLAQYSGTKLQYWNILAGSEAIGRFQPDILHFGNPERFYYLKDHLGSVRVTVANNGNIAGWDDYYPFGLQMPGREDNSANDFDDQKFTGHFLEQEGDLGIYHAGARLYDPEVPRFYGVDAMRVLYPTLSPYHYTLNNPILYIDPTGEYVVRGTKVTRPGLGTARGLGVWSMVPIAAAASPIYKSRRGDPSDRVTTMDYISMAVGGAYRSMMKGFENMAQLPRNYRRYGGLANPDRAFSIMGAFDDFFVENIQEIYLDEVLFDVAGYITYKGMNLGQTDGLGLTFFASNELIEHYDGDVRDIARVLSSNFEAIEERAKIFLDERPYFDLTNERHRARLRSYLRDFIRIELNPRNNE